MNDNLKYRKHIFRDSHRRKFKAVAIECGACGAFVFYKGKGAHLKKYCSLCLIKADQANSARYRAKYSDKLSEGRHRRRAAKKSVECESFTLKDVIARWGTDCHICRNPINMDLPWPHRMSKSQDHVIPISKGGPHKLSNVKLAHLTCNQRKSDRVCV